MTCIARSVSLPEEFWRQLDNRGQLEGGTCSGQIRAALVRAGFCKEAVPHD